MMAFAGFVAASSMARANELPGDSPAKEGAVQSVSAPAAPLSSAQTLRILGAPAPGPALAPAARGPSIAALPGFPGAQGVYHHGASGFFLDRPELDTLTPEQRTALAARRDEAARGLADAERKLVKLEGELWALTGADQPDAWLIAGKLTEIEKVRSEQRMAFVRHVGEAAGILSPEQRALLGSAPRAPAGAPPAAPPPGVAAQQAVPPQPPGVAAQQAAPPSPPGVAAQQAVPPSPPRVAAQQAAPPSPPGVAAQQAAPPSPPRVVAQQAAPAVNPPAAGPPHATAGAPPDADAALEASPAPKRSGKAIASKAPAQAPPKVAGAKPARRAKAPPPDGATE